MKIVGRDVVDKAKSRLGDQRLNESLDDWLHVVERAKWNSFQSIRATYRKADRVVKNGIEHYVFDHCRNDYRLISRINFPAQLVIVDKVLKHKEYDRW